MQTKIWTEATEVEVTAVVVHTNGRGFIEPHCRKSPRNSLSESCQNSYRKQLSTKSNVVLNKRGKTSTYIYNGITLYSSIIYFPFVSIEV